MIFSKPKFWDYKKPSIWSIILYPFSLIYLLITIINKIFLSQKKFSILIICIGNFYFGGTGKTPLAMLLNVASFYKEYYHYNKQFGGCPILNIGVDANNQNKVIAQLVQLYNHRILEQFSILIEKAKEANEIKNSIDSMLYAKRFFYMIEGAVYMTHIMKDDSYLKDVSVVLQQIIKQELQK